MGTAALIGLLEALTALTERVLMMLATDVGEIIPFMVPVILVALSASWATWHFRSPRDRVGWEAKLTLALAFAVFCVTLLPDFLLGLSALLGILPDNILNFTLSHMLSMSYALGMSVADLISVASVALGLTWAIWRFRRRGICLVWTLV
jgi:hypothetical protein